MRGVDQKKVKAILNVSTEYFDRAKLFFNENPVRYEMEVGLRVWRFMPYKGSGNNLQPKGSFKKGFIDFPGSDISQIYDASLSHLEVVLKEYIDDFLESD